MAKVIPVLGPSGFASDLTIKVDEAFSNFYIAQMSQSDMFRFNTASLGAIIAKYGNSELEVTRELRQVLDIYLSRNFDEVTLDVTSTSTDSSIQIQLSCILRDGNDQIDIRHVISAKDSKIRSIIDLQNDGRPIKWADNII